MKNLEENDGKIQKDELCLYYSACVLMSLVLHGYDYLLDEIQSKKIQERALNGWDAFDSFGNWVSDEVFIDADKGIRQAEEIYDLEKYDLLEPLAFGWGEIIRETANQNQHYFSLGEEDTRYFIACEWILHMLFVFERFITESIKSEWSQIRLKQGRGYFWGLVDWMQKELSELKEQMGIGEFKEQKRNHVTKATCERLGLEWSKAVHNECP